MKYLVAAALLTVLAACEAPYDAALQARMTPRPEAPVTKADAAALAPYDTAAYFKAK